MDSAISAAVRWGTFLGSEYMPPILPSIPLQHAVRSKIIKNMYTCAYPNNSKIHGVSCTTQIESDRQFPRRSRSCSFYLAIWTDLDVPDPLTCYQKTGEQHLTREERGRPRKSLRRILEVHLCLLNSLLSNLAVRCMFSTNCVIGRPPPKCESLYQ